MTKLYGKRKDKFNFIKGIDENDFVDLVADLLFYKYNHSEIKIMDGPGDGKRDILSKTSKGEKCLSQCKYHSDPNKTCSSSETNEVIIGLNKFGYKVGKFFTSSRISPQGKREYEDNFPGFNLEYKEGHEIVDDVLDDAILSSIWIKDSKIVKNLKRIVFTIIIRDMKDNVPYDVNEVARNIKFEEIEDIKIKTTHTCYKKLIFEPYEAPDIKTYYEKWGDPIVTVSAEITGDLSLYKIETYKDIILKSTTNYLSNNSCSAFIIRFGKLFLQDINSDLLKYELELPDYPISYYYNSEKNILNSEYEWFMLHDGMWNVPKEIRSSQLENYRLFNEENDICLNLCYLATSTFDDLDKFREEKVFQNIIWDNSLFIFSEKVNIENFINDNSLIPDKFYEYGPNGLLVAWLHPTPMCRPVIIGALKDYERKVVSDSFDDEKNRVRELASQYGLEILDSKKAYYVACLNDDDPFIDESKCVHETIQCMDYHSEIPSPMNPKNRTFEYEVIWLFYYNEDYNNSDDYIKAVYKKISEINLNIEANIYIDNSYEDSFCIYYSFILDYNTDYSTNEIVNLHLVTIKEVINKVEKTLYLSFKNFHRGTKEYWLNQFEIYF